jgi:predicted dehydrogenase
MTSINPVRVAVLGAGGRGTVHGRRVRRTGGVVVAVAEPDPLRRDRLADEHRIPAGARWAGWRELAAAEASTGVRVADAVLVTTQDADHVEPCERFAALGYHILCEKPMAPTEAGAVRIADAVERAGVIFAVCHTLRYTAYTRRVREVVASGRIGDIVSVQHLEPVGWWHFAHSYVRGNWRREDESSSMLMAKCCHDLDWLNFVIGSRPTRVSSFGRLTHFRPENRPAGAGDRCLDCAVEPDCPYSAPRLYHSRLGDPRWNHSPVGAVTDTPTPAGVDAALATGPYGRCVYDCDNDVVDHQVVALDYANGVTATHTVTAFTPMRSRMTRIFGTHGFLEGDGHELALYDFRTGPDIVPEAVIPPSDQPYDHLTAHDDGDRGAVEAFVRAVATGDPSPILSGPTESVDSHRAVWAAERARRTGRVIQLVPAS